MMSSAPANGFRTFLIVWLTQSVSVFGSALTIFAVTIWLTQVVFAAPGQQRELALAITAVSLARSIPTILGAPLAGAWVDRHNRKLTMLSMDLLNGVLSLCLVSLIVAGQLRLPLLLAIMALASLFDAFHYAAFDTSYVMIVPTNQLPRANGMMQTMSDLSSILSPGIAAAVIALPALARQGLVPGMAGRVLEGMTTGMPLAIALDAVTFFAAGLSLVFLAIPSPQRNDLSDRRTRTSIWADLREGALFIWLRRPMLWLLASFTVANLLGSPIFALQPLLIKFSLASDWTQRGFSFETALALMNSMASLGGVIGGLIISAWGGLKRRRVYGILIPMVIAAVAELAFGLSSWLYLSVAMICVLSAMIPIMNAHNKSIWQALTPVELQGRVLGVRRVIVQFTWPLSTALAGWASGLLAPGVVVVIMGAGFVAFSVLQLFNRSLQRVDDEVLSTPVELGPAAH